MINPFRSSFAGVHTATPSSYSAGASSTAQNADLDSGHLHEHKNGQQNGHGNGQRNGHKKSFLQRLVQWEWSEDSLPSDLTPNGFHPTEPQTTEPQTIEVEAQPVDSSKFLQPDPASVPSSFPSEGVAQEALQTGHRHFQQGNWYGAIVHYRVALERDPNLAEAYEYLAEALTQQGNLAEAATCYRQAITLAQFPAQESLPSEEPSPPPPPIPEAEEEVQEPTKPQAQKGDLSTIPWFEQASFYLQQAIVICNAKEWEEAHTTCQKAIEHLEPQAATAYLISGRSLQGQKQFADAESAYRKALALKPSAETYARLGSLYAEQQRFAEAVPCYQTALQLDANFAGAYRKLAEAWEHLSQEAEAVSCWYQAFQLQPRWAKAADYCRLGERLLNLGQLDLSQQCYESALKRQPDLAAAQFGLGRVLSQQGHVLGALAQYRRVLEQNQTAELYTRLGEELMQLEQWEEARICYEKLRPLAPQSELAQSVLALKTCCIQLAAWEDALIYSQQGTVLQPDQSQGWHDLGDVLSRLERWTEAVTAYQQAITLAPGFSWSHNNLGDALIQLEQWQEAADAFQTAILLHPGFAWSHYNLGRALVAQQDWDGAIAAYRQALQLEPNLPHAPGHLADALQQRAMLDQSHALDFYRQAIERDPLDPDPYHKALELQPDAVDLYLGLIEALMVQNRLDEALVCCQLARQVQPDDEAILAKLKEVLQQRLLTHRPRTAADAAENYQRWMAEHTPTPEQLRQKADLALSLDYQPLISVLMPVYNPPEPFLRAAIESVLNQVYLRWELCIADDASDAVTQAVLQDYAARDRRIKLVMRSEQGHVSAASNSALAMATGEFVALLDHDDVLAPEALYEVAVCLNQHPEADFIYSDEDKLDAQGQRVHPFFKPDWCPDSFLSRMYTCHLGVYRRRVVHQIGSFRVGYEGSQDYDLVLRLTEQTTRIFHIPQVLYHWRSHPESMAGRFAAKPYADAAAQRALTEACQRRQEPIQRIETHPDRPGVYILRYQITEYKPVSIIIPTRNLGDILDQCLHSLFTKTTYPNYEVILIDNGSDELDALNVIAKWEQKEPDRLRCYSLDIPFNYSHINNLAVAEASGDYLLFLNNDVEIIAPDWIEAMVEQAQRPSIGAVGGLLLYPDDTVQHAGVVLGVGGVAGHSHKYFPVNDWGYVSQLISVNNYSAVTAACLMCRRSVFDQVGGFDPALAVSFNDVDLCLKIRQAGYQNIALPQVRLYHHESKSRGLEDTPEKRHRFQQERDMLQQRWGEQLQQDPCYSPHLSLDREDYSIRL